jgi:hypothetical protein
VEDVVIDEDDEISNNDVSQAPRSVVNKEEEEEEEEDGELFEIEIDGKDYFTDDDDNGNIYGKLNEDEPSDDPIGVFKDGVPSFF